MVLISEALEVAGDRWALRNERRELLAHDGGEKEYSRRQDRRDDAVECDERGQPGDAAPLGCVHHRVQHHGQDPGEDEGPQDAPDREGQDQGQDAQDTEEDQGAEIAAPPQLIDPASLDHRGIIHCSNEEFEPRRAARHARRATGTRLF